MATSDRRRKLTIAEINEYWRRLKRGTEQPNVYKLCNAIRVLDLALAETDSALCKRLSTQAWARIRNDCFDMVITSCPGHFMVYEDSMLTPLDPSDKWPEAGHIEFYPEKANRRDDAVTADLIKIHHSIVLRLRWCFAEGCHNITPSDFSSYREFSADPADGDEGDQTDTLDEVYEVCADEASTLRKIAHRKWWHLHYQARGCSDSRQRGRLKKQMEELELIWGRSR